MVALTSPPVAVAAAEGATASVAFPVLELTVCNRLVYERWLRFLCTYAGRSAS